MCTVPTNATWALCSFSSWDVTMVVKVVETESALPTFLQIVDVVGTCDVAESEIPVGATYALG